MDAITRRDFIKGSAVATAALMASGTLSAQNRSQSSFPPYRNLVSPDKPVRLAFVGVGGQGFGNVRRLLAAGGQAVAFCDVDMNRAGRIFGMYPSVPRFKDYREMLEKMDKQIDAVVITTPDHMHFPISMLALNYGKHIYVEKPSTHTIGEARHLKKAAQEARLVAQMGNPGMANEGTRYVKEWIDAGVLGNVKEVHCWTNRPVWPQNMNFSRDYAPAPETLDWNLWLGVAPFRDYAPGIAPFNWRGYWEYGCGAIGDMGCHTLAAPVWALNLTGPVKVYAEYEDTPQHATTMSKSAKITWEYPARGKLGPVKIVWYEGKLKPDVPKEMGPNGKLGRMGMIIYGDKNTLLDETQFAGSPRLIPAKAMAEFNKNRPDKTIPRVQGNNNYAEFIRACQGGPRPTSDVAGIGSDLTEMTLLGNLALRTGKTIEWDAAAGVCKGMPELNRFVHKNYRDF